MKNLIILIAISFATLSAKGQWTAIPSGTTLDLRQIAFADSLNGFIIAMTGFSNSVLLRTTDGGYNWTQVLTNNRFTAIDFLNSDTGAVLTSDTIYKTIDGGNTWKMIPTKMITGNYDDLFHMNNELFWIYVRGQHWGRTEDGGITWIDSTNGNSGALPIVTTDFQFINDTTVIGVGWYGPRSFRSTDAGLNWTGLGFPNASYLWSCCFISSSIGFATGTYGTQKTIYKSIDGGISWTKIDSILNFGIYCLRHIDSNNFYGVGSDGGIAKSTDGGMSWTTDVSGTTNHLNKIIFINSHTAIAIGDNGTILMNPNISTGIEDVNSYENMVSVFPNPSNDILSFQSNSSQQFYFTLYNSIGECVIDEILVSKTSMVNLSGYSNGIYFYKLTSNKQVIKSGKIIKQ